MCNVFCTSRNSPNKPLGSWIHVLEKMWWYSVSEKSLCFQDSSNLSVAQQQVPESYKARGNEKWFRPTPQLEKPDNVLPAICITKGLRTLFTGFNSINNKVTSAIPSTLQWALNDVEGWYNVPKLIEALSNGTLIASTDGSFKNNRGAAAWELCDSNNIHIFLHGKIHSPGHPDYPDSTRTELSGFYGIASAIFVIYKLYNSIPGS